MSVVHVIGQLNVGGAERHFVSLLNAMTGVERSAVFVSELQPGTTLHHALDASVGQHTARVRRRSLPVGIWRLARLFRRLRADVVHTHMYWPNLCAVPAARLAGVPVVITTEHGENRWKKAHHRFLERRVISPLTDRRFCVSEDILKARRARDGVPAEKLELCPNGTAVPDEAAVGSNSQVPVIGTVGRAVAEKDHGNLLEAVRILSEAGRRLRVCVVGDGPCLAELKQRVANAGLTSAFEFPGMVMDVDVWYRRFDLFVLSSRQEGQPVALLEAMALGLPCVATDVGAIGATMKQGKEGTVVPPQDAAALAAGIAGLLDDDRLRRAQGEAARERVRRDFSIEAVARRHLECYREALAARRRSAS